MNPSPPERPTVEALIADFRERADYIRRADPNHATTGRRYERAADALEAAQQQLADAEKASKWLLVLREHPLGCEDCMDRLRPMVARGARYLDATVLCPRGWEAFVLTRAALSAGEQEG